jgi:hypothetical protein
MAETIGRHPQPAALQAACALGAQASSHSLYCFCTKPQLLLCCVLAEKQQPCMDASAAVLQTTAAVLQPTAANNCCYAVVQDTP